MASNYPFPLLDVNELVQNFKQELPELTLTQNDFTNPKNDRWQVMYTMLLEVLTDISPEHILQPPLEVVSNLQYPELYEEAIPLYTLAMYMQRIMCACGLQDFTLRDITDPKPKRLQRNMSAILNFLYFRSNRLEVYESIKEENASQLKMRDKLIKENMDLKTEINRIRSERAMQEPTLKELDTKNEDLQKYLETMTESTTHKKKVLSETNTRITEKKAKLAELKAHVASAKEDGNRLSRQIVQSPERMKENIGRMGQKLEQLRLVKEQRRARVAELQEMKDNLAQISSYCDQALDLTNKIGAEVTEQKDKQREIETMRDKLVEKRDELQDLEAHEHQLQRIIASKQEKFSKMAFTQKNKKQSLENKLQLLREEKEIIGAKQTEAAAQKGLVYQAQGELEAAESSDSARHERLMDQMKTGYASLLEQLEMYHGKLTESWTGVRCVP